MSDASAGAIVYEETRYFVPNAGWAGLDFAVDSQFGTAKKYRLQSTRQIAGTNEALTCPCGACRPDGG